MIWIWNSSPIYWSTAGMNICLVMRLRGLCNIFTGTKSLDGGWLTLSSKTACHLCHALKQCSLLMCCCHTLGPTSLHPTQNKTIKLKTIYYLDLQCAGQYNLRIRFIENILINVTDLFKWLWRQHWDKLRDETRVGSVLDGSVDMHMLVSTSHTQISNKVVCLQGHLKQRDMPGKYKEIPNKI